MDHKEHYFKNCEFCGISEDNENKMEECAIFSSDNKKRKKVYVCFFCLAEFEENNNEII